MSFMILNFKKNSKKIFIHIQNNYNKYLSHIQQENLNIYWSFNETTHQPNTLLSNPDVNRLTPTTLSSTQAALATILLCPCLLERGSLANLCPDKSNNLTCLLSCGIAIIPFAETLNLFTAESTLIVATGYLIFFRSHTFTLLSSEPETTLSSLVNTAEVTLLKFSHKY